MRNEVSGRNDLPAWAKEKFGGISLKKLLAIALALFLVLSLAACSSGTADSSPEASPTDSSPAWTPTDNGPEASPTESSPEASPTDSTGDIDAETENNSTPENSVDPDLLSMTVILNGAAITLPCEVDEFTQKTGFRGDDYDQTRQRQFTDGNNELSITLSRKSGKIVIISVSTLDADEKIQEFDTAASSIFLPKNVTIGMTINEVEAAYGPYVYDLRDSYIWTINGERDLEMMILRVYTDGDGTVRSLWYGYSWLYFDNTEAETD